MFSNPKPGILTLPVYVLNGTKLYAKKTMASLAAVLFFYTAVYSQTQTHLQVLNDSVRVTNGEFILRNGTSNVNGFLYNNGNGITAFKHGLVRIDDTTYVIGGDTLHVKASGGSAGWGLTGNPGTNSGVNFLGTVDTAALVFQVNNMHAKPYP